MIKKKRASLYSLITNVSVCDRGASVLYQFYIFSTPHLLSLINPSAATAAGSAEARKRKGAVGRVAPSHLRNKVTSDFRIPPPPSPQPPAPFGHANIFGLPIGHPHSSLLSLYRLTALSPIYTHTTRFVCLSTYLSILRD